MKIFDNADKEVDLAVNHFVRAAGNAVRKQEIDEFRKKIGDSFTDLKKLLIKIKQAKKVSLAKYAPEEMVEIEANMPPDEIDESTKTGYLDSVGGSAKELVESKMTSGMDRSPQLSPLPMWIQQVLSSARGMKLTRNLWYLSKPFWK